MGELKFETVRSVMSDYDSEFWLAKTSSGQFPMATDVKPRLCKIWRFADRDNYVWVDGNNEKRAMERYIAALDIITGKASKDLLHNLQKMVARVFVRYRLDPDLLDLYETKEGFGHAAYNRDRNSMRFVPDYYLRFGVIRLGKVLVPEFHKTIVHEYGHMLWHRWTSKKEKEAFIKIIPEFRKIGMEEPEEGWYKPSVVSIIGEESKSDYMIPIDTLFLSRQELLSPKECFAETFALYTIDPNTLKEKFPERYRYMEKVIDTNHRILSSSKISKEDVKVKGKRVKLSDFIPIDLQINEYRIRLANLFEQKLTVLLGEIGSKMGDVKAIVPLGDYSSVEQNPIGIHCAVHVPELPKDKEQRYQYGHTDAQMVTISLLSDETKFNAYVYQTTLFERKAKEGAIEQMRDVAKGSRKHRPHQTLLGRSETLPVGHAAPKPQAGSLKLDRPLQTRYAIQEHLAERAGKHYDFRIKVGNLAYSWVLPKGLPKRGQRRLAILQPPHKTSYMGFQGTIKSGYGRGQVRIADAGPMEVKTWDKNKKVFSVLAGPSTGEYAMVKTKGKNWIIVPVKKKPITSQYKLKDYRMRPKKRMLISRRYSVQPRRGGPKVAVYIGDKENRILTRTEGRKRRGFVERTDNYPHIRDLHLGKPGTVVEGELYSHTPEISNAISISSPFRARMLQQKAGRARLYVNDIMALEGEDVRQLPYRQRMRILRRTVSNTKYVKKSPFITGNKKKKLKEWFNRGYHGAYVIDRKGPYDNMSGLYLSSKDIGIGKEDRMDDIRKMWVPPEKVRAWYATNDKGNRVSVVGRKRKKWKPMPAEKQHDPAEFTLKLRRSMWKDPNYVLQPKLDGSRYLLYTSKKGNRLLSRHVSVKEGVGHVERTENVPHIRDTKLRRRRTVLDGEIIRRDFKTTQRIMGSGPNRSLDLQDKLGRPVYVAFDILRYGGKDIRNLPYEKRLRYLKKAVPKNNKYIRMMPTFAGKNKKSKYRELVRMGYEGIVMKDRTKGYGEPFMTKKKKVRTGDFVVMGFTEGRGRNEGRIGAIQIGQWDPETNQLIPRGKVGTGLTDRDRDWWAKHGKSMVGNTVIEVKYMERTHKGIPRHPVFMRVRLDKSPSQAKG